MELLKKNELEANKVASNVMLVTFGVFVVVYILDLLGIFITDKTLMTIAFIIGSVCLWIPTIIVRALKKTGPAVKYIIIAVSVLFIAFMDVTLTYHVYVMFIFPLAIASLYFSKRLSVFATALTIIGNAAAQIIAFALQTHPDDNYTEFNKNIIFNVIPKAMMTIALAAIFTMLAKRASAMLGSLMSAEQQNRMREKSLEVSERLLGAVAELDRISAASAEANRSIADESSEVMQGSEQNAENIIRVEANMKSISDNLTQLSEMSREIAKLASESNKITAENDELINGAYSSMNEVCKSTDESREIISLLSEQSKQIVGIANVITDISRQTNILAINAAIEASRAGEYGKGFAVVAGEIGSLSSKTNVAAAEIGKIIKNITDDISKTVESMSKNSELTRESMEFMEKIKEFAGLVSSSSNGISEHISSINAIIENAAQNGENVSHHISEVSGTIRENSEAVHHVAASIQENSADAEVLGSMVKDISQMAAELEMLTK